jgi:hypothetical protein
LRQAFTVWLFVAAQAKVTPFRPTKHAASPKSPPKKSTPTYHACTLTRLHAQLFPLIFGIIANSTRQALQHARAVRDLPVAALMVTPPHYLFTPSETEMFAYFRSITEETGLPVLVYNVVP